MFQPPQSSAQKSMPVLKKIFWLLVFFAVMISGTYYATPYVMQYINKFATVPEETNVQTYAYFSKEGDANCQLVYPVERRAQSSYSLLEETVSFVLRGPSEAEKNQGYTSLFHQGTANGVIRVNVVDSVAYVNFKDWRNAVPAGSTSCGSSNLLAALDASLKQFNIIKETRYAFNGDAQIFYEWVQLGCSEANDNCDSKNFK